MIVVTGATGLLGANVVLAALNRGHAVAAIAHRKEPRFAGALGRHVDLTDAAVTERLFEELRPRLIIHCAAMTDVDRCQQFPAEAQRVNVDVPRRIAAVARRYGAGLVYVSTDAVFDGSRGGYEESDRAEPCNVYARSKLDGEAAVRAELDGAAVVRTNLFGWNAQPKQSLAEWIVARLEAGERVPGFRDVRFNPLLVNDLAEILLDLGERRFGETLHLGSADACSKLEFARSVANAFALDASLVDASSVDAARFRAPRPRDTTLRTDLAVRLLGRPMPTVHEALERFRRLREDGFVQRLKASLGD